MAAVRMFSTELTSNFDCTTAPSSVDGMEDTGETSKVPSAEATATTKDEASAG